MGRGRRGGQKSPIAAPPLTAISPTADMPAESNAPQPPPAAASTALPPPRKRQKREDYRNSINKDESRSAELPKKKWFRQRAHANPFSDHRLTYPVAPDQMDWSKHYPAFVAPLPAESTVEGDAEERPRRLIKNVEIADIGCGYGGLLFALGPSMPDTLILGLEIRTSITEFVDSKIRALRQQSTTATTTTTTTNPKNTNTQSTPDLSTPILPAPGHYANISTQRSNTMKFLPNFFPAHTLSAIFLCFPDPHFKSRKHKARIVSAALNAEYAYVLREGGVVYTVTDVEELGGWIRGRFDAHPAFGRVRVGVEVAGEEGGRVWREDVGGEGDEGDKGDGEGGGKEEERRGEAQADAEVDRMVKLMLESTEEGRKVERFGGNKFVGVWRRLPDPPWPGEGEEDA